MIDYNSAASYVMALTGSIDTQLDWRCIHDQKKDIPAHSFHGTLSYVWKILEDYNNRGYGIFVNINELDGNGKELSNVKSIRAHVIDLDNLVTAEASYERACQMNPAPAFAVRTSPGKYHVYWTVEPYKDNDFYTLHQRKLRQLYDGDKSIIDPTRVLRVPGFYHKKAEPYLVHCWGLAGIGKLIPGGEIGKALHNVNVIDHSGSRHQLGDKTLAAPSLDWLKKGIAMVDPNSLDRGEWISFTAAIKQAGWSLTDSDTLFNIWSDWCAKYEKNDIGENLKQWNSIRETEVGWNSIMRKTPIKAHMLFDPNINPTTWQPDENTEGEEFTDSILKASDCKRYFKNCFFISNMEKIFTPKGRFMGSTAFNGTYGGKHFIISNTGKTTDEAWKAALRSTEYTIPKVDHIRFLPQLGQFEMIEDEIGRLGLNTYVPAKIKATPGDISLWENHMMKILPDAHDRKLFFDYLAHCVKFPGYKIPWSILFQSVEGIGKTAFTQLLQHALGLTYVYEPPAPELIASGSKFNGWMRNKLMIVVNEIKIDERRELIEILKPMITDERVQIQSKGVDQQMEDNVANWLFFSNYKDAIPIHKNGRRYAIFYSSMQTEADMIAAGMDTPYFNRLWDWLKNGGYEAITHWLLNYPIEKGGLPVRAPRTTSYDEAIKISRSPAEIILQEAILDELPGFRGGYVSSIAVINRLKASGIRNVTTKTVTTVMQNMGYTELGKAIRAYHQEDMLAKSMIYVATSDLKIEGYGTAQGYN